MGGQRCGRQVEGFTHEVGSFPAVQVSKIGGPSEIALTGQVGVGFRTGCLPFEKPQSQHNESPRCHAAGGSPRNLIKMISVALRLVPCTTRLVGLKSLLIRRVMRCSI